MRELTVLLVLLGLLGLILIGCSSQYSTSEYKEMGYRDGYRAGYNITCKIGPTTIHDFKNATYQSAYSNGYSRGSLDCIANEYERE